MHEELYQAFERASGELIRSLDSLDEAQINQVPFEGSWTAGQLGHHLLMSYGAVDILNGRTSSTDRPVDEKIVPIEKAFQDRDNKMEAPERVRPTDGWIEKERLLGGLKKKTGQVLDYLKEDEQDLTRTCLDLELPGVGTLTREEWIRFMTVHTQRHVHQLKDIISTLE